MNTDRIAKPYCWLEYAAFGRALERRRRAFLGRLGACRRALLVGEGDGRFAARLAGENAEARVEVVELSGRMIALARARLPAGAEARVRFRQEDIRDMDWRRESLDLVVTHFFLDCLTASEAAALIARLSGALETGGLWVVSEFQLPAGGRLRRIYAAAWLSTLYGFFGVTTGLRVARLPDYGGLLRGAGLALVEEQEAHFGLLVSQLWKKV